MDFEYPAEFSAETGDEPARKERRRGGMTVLKQDEKNHARMQVLLSVLAKLVLSNSLQV